MRSLGPATEAEMVLAYLRAEINAPRWRQDLAHADRNLIESPDLEDAAQNEARAALLGRWRGFRSQTGYFEGRRFFEGFPDDVRWESWSFTPAEVGAFLYSSYPTWLRLSEQTRLVKVGAANVDRFEVLERGRSINADIREVAAAVDEGRRFEPLICATLEPTPSSVTIIEGHTRATAYLYARRPPDEIVAIVGWSSGMRGWRNY